MIHSLDQAAILARTSLALTLSAAIVMTGCEVRVAAPPPPPPRPVYVAPPPPADSAPVEVEIHASEAPPPLPDYEQPPCPEDGYLWTPGYWAWGGGGYYWVPGTWVQPPRVGVLWTPGYWGFVGGVYAFHAGYWGPHVGFYGGVNYGFGYGGVGFAGGRWQGNSFAYNRTVVNVNVTNVHNTYNETVINNVTINKVSYNGGPAGTNAQPTAQERAFAAEPHVPPTAMQRQHINEASRNPALAARANGGHPAIAATPRAGAFNAPGVIGARGVPASQVKMVAAQNSPAGAHPGGSPGQTVPPRAAGGVSTNAGARGSGAPAAAAGQPGAGKPGMKAAPAKPQRPKAQAHKHEGDDRK
jgi:hypothetical protein